MNLTKHTQLTTRTEVIDYLTKMGRDNAIARAMSIEMLDHSPEPGEDAIWSENPQNPNGNFIARAFITGEEALDYFDSFMFYGINVTHEGIEFDGELMFNLNGNLLNDEMRSFTARAQETKFTIETPRGFWNRELGQHFPLAANGTQFSWLEQEDHLIECMGDISNQQGGWFRVVCIKPFVE